MNVAASSVVKIQAPVRISKRNALKTMDFYRLGLTLLTTLIASIGSGCAWVDSTQRHMVFMPTAEIVDTPEDFKVRYEEVWIPIPATTREGRATERLNAWWIPADNPHAPAVLYLHGNDLNIGDSAFNSAQLQRLGFSVLAIDYRGFGKSGGVFPSEAQVYEDAQTAWLYLKSRIPQGRKRYIYGHSLGGAVGIDLAVKNPDAAGLIVESTFTSILDMGKRIDGIRYLPLDWILTQRFDSLAKIGKLNMPVLLFHGTADDTVPYDMSQRLYDAAPQPKRLVLIPNADHSSVPVIGSTQYGCAVHTFMRMTGLTRKAYAPSKAC